MNHRIQPAEEPPLPLAIAATTFRLLATGPGALDIDARTIAGLPRRRMRLDEVSRLLLDHYCPDVLRDEIWRYCITQARTHGAAWTLACTGLALPALASVVAWVRARCPAPAHDVEAETLTGFLAALDRVRLDVPAVLVRLRWAAFRAAYTVLADSLDAPIPTGHVGFASRIPVPPWGHPDLVLAQAVRARVVTRTEADLIGATRLEAQSVTDWAQIHHVSRAAAYKMRQRAEHRLADYLTDPDRSADRISPITANPAATGPVSLPVPTRPPSRFVTARRAGDVQRRKELDPHLSNPGPIRGLTPCGHPAPAPRQPGEAHRCA